MHEGEFAVTGELVTRLVAAQFPHWAGWPLTPVASSGTVNALFRLGTDLVVRLPRVDWSLGATETEGTWLPLLAPRLPVAIPEQVAVGVPGEGYPWPWAVYRWLPGTVPVEDKLTDPLGLAADLAAFVRAMRAVDLADAPAAYRGGGHSLLDPPARAALAGLAGLLDPAELAAIGAALDADLGVPDYAGPPVWLHADLMPGNLLVDSRGRLAAVIDFATLGVGDPSCDLIVAWNLLTPEGREVFRAALGVDEPTWRRGRGRALAIAVIALVYYHQTNPAFAGNARYVIREVLAACDPTKTG
ncbi:aminoglycoside phosphotransferase (APT) family kinase protein [Asanoa ferruginea]|uniref:Aminoglycoside phosphotransferase (APT) family kinase protein n=1 Tax=Asanoa ferruginea TaxID=53367 RepID=A0A3D9ZKI8_9ACTN|nr:aminoglycoside phosphotransferase family protein [Asanoa ferruginea]REF97936.1 aminoglycoside phosphotransferase (APT) family kinase protein [Asanoa ferruginea]GIF50038.1 phosphotransferase [Asanoa ferruginea]